MKLLLVRKRDMTHFELVNIPRGVKQHDSLKKILHMTLLLLEATLNLFVLLCHSASIFCPDFMASLIVFDPSFLRPCVEGCCDSPPLHIEQHVYLVTHGSPTLGARERAVALVRQTIVWENFGLRKHFKFHISIFLLQGLAMSRTPNTLAAKSLQSYICDLQNKIP